MNEQDEVAADRWWRFSEYELVAGVVRPTVDAEVEWFNPLDRWASYAPTPYLEFIELATSLRLAPSSDGRTSAVDEEALAQLLCWCQRWGLPGTLLQRTEALYTPVTWRRFGDALVPAQFQLFRSTTGWAASERDWVGRGSWRPKAEGRRAGTSLRHGDLPEDAFPAGVLMRELRGPRLRLHPLRAVTPYLGDAVRRKRWQSLLLLSEPFCRAYGEPMTDFLNAAAALRDALTWLATPDPLNPPDEERVGEMKDGAALLAYLLAASGRSLTVEDGELREAQTSRSLIGSFASMIRDDALGGTARRCPRCGKPFRASHYQTRFCSDKCKHTWQNRVQRSRQRLGS